METEELTTFFEKVDLDYQVTMTPFRWVDEWNSQGHADHQAGHQFTVTQYIVVLQ